MSMTRTAEFKVSLSKATTRRTSISYKTVGISAEDPHDFTMQEGQLIFEPGEYHKTIQIRVREDEEGQPAERFLVSLFNPDGLEIARVDGICDIPAGAGQAVQSNGPLILHGLITNAYHNELGRGGYFHHNSGTSEGQSIGIEGSLLAHQALKDGSADEQSASYWYKMNGLDMLDALGDGSRVGPILRQPVSSDSNTITLMHWLFAARGDIPSQSINYDYAVAKIDNKLIIQNAQNIFRIWQIYPDSSYLLYQSPYSPSYDKTTPSADTSIKISESDWVRNGDTVEITLPAGAPSFNNWRLIIGYNNAGVIKQGKAEEAYPIWTGIDAGYAACAPDTFRWFEYALSLAMQVDDRNGKTTHWQNLRNALRRTAIKGQAISDLREVIKPMPQFDPIPIKGEPSGMFCYSNHPNALPPNATEISMGANPSWLGYGFWGRIGGKGGTVTPNAYTWTPDNMLSNPTGDMFYGAIGVSAPATSSVKQLQIGRGINDEWRVATPYQQADQFLFVAICMSQRPNFSAGERCYVFVSTSKTYSAATRYYADIGQYAELALGNANKPGYILVPRTAFKRKDGDNAELPAGTRLENFGISFEMKVEYNAQIVAMRLLSGPSEQWVRDNLQSAVKGSAMPFMPGAMPFAINADTIKQQFVGWNGSPFHGYQLPDFWYFLQNDVNFVHPSLKASDLPVTAANSTTIQYPINEYTLSGAKKTVAALLCEQQLLFLKTAQDRWVLDGGALGFFAHTLVMNTPARSSIGNPQPHTWVYTNDDPNTRWVGYQARVLDSLSRLTYLSKDNSIFERVNSLSLLMAMNFIDALNIAWPNLNGVLVNGVRIYGMPTDFGNPALGGPQILYEEPHAAALVLRACMWLKLSGKLSNGQLNAVNSLGLRCWNYLEMRYRNTAADKMRYTWSNDNENWYGFWHFEIIATLAYLLKNPTAKPDGIDLITVRKRLVDTVQWLKNNVR